ncbi:MAG: O-antigen ligase family protein [Vicinamibacterales bacterium]
MKRADGAWLVRRWRRDSRIAQILLAIALAASQFNYLIVSLWRDEREPVAFSPEFWGGSAFLVGAFYITGGRRTRGSVPAAVDLRLPVYLLAACCIWVVVGNLVHGVGPRGVITAASLVLYLVAASRLFERYLGGMYRSLPGIILAIVGVWMIALWGSELVGRAADRYTGLLWKLEIRGGLRSTELAIFTGQQFAWLLYVWLASRRAVERGLAAVFIVMNIGLLFRLFALSAIVGYAAVVAVFLLLNGRRYRVLIAAAVCAAGMIVVSRNPTLVTDLSEAFSGKMADVSIGREGRSEIYAYLWELALRHPFTGIGSGRFVEVNQLGWQGTSVTPHNNLLQLAAENGLPAALLYFGFVLSVVVAGIRGARECRTVPWKIPMLLSTTGFACFAYQQLRGLVQETWLIKETYLWAGAVLGTVAFARHLRVSAHAGPYENRRVSNPAANAKGEEPPEQKSRDHLS